MKKILILSIAVISLLSCSKNDDAAPQETQLAKTFENLLGKWQIVKLTRPGGAVVVTEPSCAGKPIIIEFIADLLKMECYYKDYQCALNGAGSNTVLIDSEGVFYLNAIQMFADTKITSLTQTTLEIVVPTGVAVKTDPSFVGEAIGYSLIRYVE